MRNKTRFPISVTLERELIEELDAQAKRTGFSRSRVMSQYVWLARASVTADHCAGLVTRLQRNIFEVEQQGGAVNEQLLATCSEAVFDSIAILAECTSGNLGGVSRVLCDLMKKSEHMNKKRWASEIAESAGAKEAS